MRENAAEHYNYDDAPEQYEDAIDIHPDTCDHGVLYWDCEICQGELR